MLLHNKITTIKADTEIKAATITKEVCKTFYKRLNFNCLGQSYGNEGGNSYGQQPQYGNQGGYGGK